jgi:hypothetical protein
MIRNVLLPALLANFPNRGFQAKESPRIGIFPAEHPDVGDVTIVDDDSEVTVYVGDITHGHFNPYDQALTDEQVAEEVTADVVQFLNDLFADRVLLFKSPKDGSGGWRLLSYDHQYSLGAEALTYLWSGPVANPDIIDAG